MNEAAPIIGEFFVRQRMAKLGFSEPIGEQPAWKIDAFMLIDSEFEQIKAKEIDKMTKARKR